MTLLCTIYDFIRTMTVCLVQIFVISLNSIKVTNQFFDNKFGDKTIPYNCETISSIFIS